MHHSTLTHLVAGRQAWKEAVRRNMFNCVVKNKLVLNRDEFSSRTCKVNCIWMDKAAMIMMVI